jgi:hypothetical protein
VGAGTRRATITRSIGSIAILTLLAAACGGGSGSPATGAPATGATATASAAASVAVMASPAVSARPSGPLALPICHEGAHCSIGAGAYITEGAGAFFPGLQLAVPDGWFLAESDNGEISLHPSDHPDDGLLIWKDIVAVVSNHRTQKGGTPMAGIGTSPGALVAWFTANPDFHVITAPKAVTVGHGIVATVLTMGVSTTADFGDPDCPVNPHCASFITDPHHWGGGFFAIGAPEVVRMFLATASYPDGDHNFVVALDVPSIADLDPFATKTKSILDSIRLPNTYVPN